MKSNSSGIMLSKTCNSVRHDKVIYITVSYELVYQRTGFAGIPRLRGSDLCRQIEQLESRNGFLDFGHH